MRNPTEAPAPLSSEPGVSKDTNRKARPEPHGSTRIGSTVWTGVELLLWGAVLVFLGVDPYEGGKRWVFTVGELHLRWAHIGIAALALSSFLRLAASSGGSSGDFLRREGLRPWVFAAAAFLAIGLLGAFLSARPSRALPYWLANAGTFLILPLVCLEQMRRHGKTLLAMAAFIYLASMVVVFHDFLLGLLGRGRENWGFIRHVNDHYVRPSAFRQEPGYFAAWMMISGSCALALVPRLEGKRKILAWTFWVLALAAAIASTSRMAAIAVFLLIVLEATLRILQVRIRRQWWVLVIAAGAVFGALWVYKSAIPRWAPGWAGHLRQGVDRPFHDPSFKERIESMDRSIVIFLENPWIGAGPACAGAWAARNPPPEGTIRDQRPISEKSPLANNIYTELLSEWGLLGTLCFAALLSFILWDFRWQGAIRLLSALAILWITNETLPRLDWWVTIWLAFSHLRSREPSTRLPLRPETEAKG